MRVFARVLALSLTAGAVVTAGFLGVFAANDSPQRTEGEDLYRRGLYPEAIALWTDQAAKGDAGAARHLGVEYMDGKGNVVQRDYEKARTYHMQAARAGDPRSMFDLGTMYEHALGVEQNIAESARWYEWSAKYGFPQGQYNFATMLEMGDGGRKDEVEAYMYYMLAAAGGVGGLPYDGKSRQFTSQGDNPMQQLGRRLTPAQVSDATTRAKAFRTMRGPMPI
jgi:TPR repeat protein